MSDAEKIKELEIKINLYEQNGGAKLFYSLNRKLSEMADMLNSISLKSIDISAKSDASFERVFKLLEKAESISAAAKAFGDFAGVTGDEDKDTKAKNVLEIATSRK